MKRRSFFSRVLGLGAVPMVVAAQAPHPPKSPLVYCPVCGSALEPVDIVQGNFITTLGPDGQPVTRVLAVCSNPQCRLVRAVALVVRQE